MTPIGSSSRSWSTCSFLMGLALMLSSILSIFHLLFYIIMLNRIKQFKSKLWMAPTLSRGFSFSWPCPRVLREIVKMSVFEKETASTCEMIWNEYHHTKEYTVSTVLTSSQYQELTSKAKNAPMFIFAVPKGAPPAHMVLVSQNQDRSFLLSFLGDF